MPSSNTARILQIDTCLRQLSTQKKIQWHELNLNPSELLPLLDDFGLVYVSNKDNLLLLGIKNANDPTLVDPLDFMDMSPRLNTLPQLNKLFFYYTDSTINQTSMIVAPGICCAEYQILGQGQRGNNWVSTFADNLLCTLKLPKTHQPQLLTRHVALVMCQTLSSLFPNICFRIKYPNDLFVDGYKIAGILVHLKEDHVLISFGLNVNMLDAAIDQPWTSLRRLTGTRHNRGLLLDHLARELTQQLHLKTLDFKTLNSYDMCMNKPVYITKSPEEIGIGKGFISRGTYLIQFPRGLYELTPNDRLRILT